MAVGTSAFVTTLAVSPVVNLVQANGNQIFGHTIYAQQILTAATTILIIGVTIYYRVACKKLFDEHKIEI